jgi:hypothetical protein
MLETEEAIHPQKKNKADCCFRFHSARGQREPEQSAVSLFFVLLPPVFQQKHP